MTILKVLEYPDPRLQEQSLPVEVFDDHLLQLADDLIDTLHASSAIGLSAAQVGVLRRVLVMDHSEDRSMPEVIVNPDIVYRSRLGLVEESCLSVPGVVTNVLRATEVCITGYDPHGNSFERELTGMPAVCLQHEMDHFDGKLLVDRINWFRRRKLKANLAKESRTAEVA